MPWDLIILSVTTVVCLTVVLFVLFAHNVHLKIKIPFAVLIISVLAWQISIYCADHLVEYALFFNNLVFLWPTVAALAFYYFFVNLSADKTHNKPLGYILVFFAVGLQVAALLSGQILNNVSAGPSEIERGNFYTVYIVGLILLLTMVILKSISVYRGSKNKPAERGPLRVVLWTAVAAIAYGVLTNIIIPLITGGQELIYLGIAVADIFAVGFLLSILRYQFLDIRFYALRAAIYSLSVIMAAFIYVIVIGVIVIFWLNVDISLGAFAGLSLLALVIASTFEPLRSRFNKFTKRIFFRDYYDSQTILNELAAALVSTVDIKQIKDKSLGLIQKSLKPEFVHFIVGRRDKNFHSLFQLFSDTDKKLLQYDDLKSLGNKDASLAIRLHAEDSDIGYIILGFKKSGNKYTSADKQLLSLIADQLSLGMQNALRFEEIQRFNQTLQEEVERATSQLQRQNDRLKLLDQTKDDFIGMASHQLRTPLTAIKGYLSMVLEGDAGKLTPLQKRMLSQSFMSAQRMVYLISDLLNVSRLRTGKFSLEMVPTNLAQVVQDEIKQLKEAAKVRNLELIYEKPEDFPTYLLDETKLRQVIMNFIDNAVYYTPGGGSIKIMLYNKPQSIEFTVSDTGIGVPKSEQQHMFTKYYRAHNAQVARPDGTGLGLFMAKKVVIAHGGAVIFKSIENRGSTFGFTLPKNALKIAPSKE